MAENELQEVLDAVGPRLRALRLREGATLAAIAASTGISVSTLSRLESGSRRPALELLLPLAQAYRVPLDELVGAPQTGDPRVHLTPVSHGGITTVPLTRQPGGVQAFKQVLSHKRDPDLRVHQGYEWLYVLSGRLRLMLGEHDVVLRSGEVAEFDTRVPHWFGQADDRPVEILTLFGPQGERMHVSGETGVIQLIHRLERNRLNLAALHLMGPLVPRAVMSADQSGVWIYES